MENPCLTTGSVSDNVQSLCNKALYNDASSSPHAQVAQLQPFASLWWRNLHSVWRGEGMLGRVTRVHSNCATIAKVTPLPCSWSLPRQ